MWIQVRSMDGSKCIRVNDLSKMTKIEELRELLINEFDATPERQRLFYRGKQLEDGHTLFDYDVGLNNIIQIMVRPVFAEQQAVKLQTDKRCNDSADTASSGDESTESNKENKREMQQNDTSPSLSSQPSTSICTSLSKYYKVGDLVDGKESIFGAWFEGKIVQITVNNSSTKSDISMKISKDEAGNLLSESNLKNNNPVSSTDCTDNAVINQIDQTKNEMDTSDDHSGINNFPECKADSSHDGLLYHVVFENYEDEEHTILNLKTVRPRARTIIPFDDVNIDSMVMVNYNIEEPNERGYWYDCKITGKKNTRTQKELYGTIFVGVNCTQIENCRIVFVNEIFAIEKHVEIQHSVEGQNIIPSASPIKRQMKPQCSHCNDRPEKKCKMCACSICGGKDNPNKQILCDECDMAFHIWCLDPPLENIPDVDEWYCPECKNDETEVVRAGEKLKESKKKSKMISANTLSNRDWGKGMACVGRTKICSIVPPNHFGSIPGIEVGMMWKYRVQVSEAGVHRPHVSGIHGRETDGAFSIVLSGGYEDDIDNGDTFYYTGSGGRDLSGNKRTAGQSCDQTLTRMNKALALNCDAPLSKRGTEAKNWRNGKPVRVVRNFKGAKHSRYCPEDGNRYDGLYKVVKYWPEKGKSGFLVWRYLLKRDDPVPAPWTKEGKKRIATLGFTMEYPDGYLEALAEKEKSEIKEIKGKGKGKRSREDGAEEQNMFPTAKVSKNAYNPPSAVCALIQEDKVNKKLWDECKEELSNGSTKFLQKVEELFQCICCQEVVFQPITTKCLHNICKPCLRRSFNAKVYSCPMCRQELGEKYDLNINKRLAEILRQLFTGYEAGR